MIVRSRGKLLSSIGILFLCVSTLWLGGCRATPVFNVLGSFFPAWMICLFLGVLLTLLVRWLFRRIDLEPFVRPLVVVYPALATLFTCTLWLLFFS